MTPLLKLAAAAIVGVTALVNSASASTITQTQGFGFGGLNGTTTLMFDGFNSGLGTLNEVIISFSAQLSLSSTAVISPAGTGNATAGVPTPVTATGTLQLTASGILFFTSLSDSLSTPGFAGTVFDNVTNTLGIANGPLSGTSGSITNPLLLSQYVGGTNLFGLVMTSFGTQGGSVPSTVFTSNNGTSEGTMTVVYNYGTSTPEPASIAVLGAGLMALGISRRRRRSS